MYGPEDVRDERAEPRILAPTDAIFRLSAACICGSDLWPWREIDDDGWPAPMGRGYARIVEEVGDEVGTIRPGQFVAFAFDATNLIGMDTNAVQDIFVRDRKDGTTRRLSVTAGGSEANDLSYDVTISDDGRFAVITSRATNVILTDTNGAEDVFIRGALF